MGGRPIEAGSRKALPGVLGVRFSGDTGLNHQGPFWLITGGGRKHASYESISCLEQGNGVSGLL